jgi:hypothetical protein
MSPKSHKSEYTILALLGLVTALVLLWMAASGLLREQRGGRTGVRTTRSTSDDGMLICYTLFGRLGLAVERSNEMLIADRLAGVGTVFLIDPLVPVGAGESENLGAWIAQGGVLVTTEVIAHLSPALGKLAQDNTPGAPPGAQPPSAGNKRPSRSGRPQGGRVPGPGQSRFKSAGGYFTQVPSKAKSLALARDVEATYFETSKTLRPDPPDPNGAASLMEPLFTEGYGVRIAQWKVGRGCVILLSDSSFLANVNIAQGDNAILSANLVSYARVRASGPRVVFNEFHYGAGYGQGVGVLAVMLFTTSPGWAVLALTAAGILFLFYKGRQFGPRRSFGQQRRRSKLEYVRAVGATYRAAGAHHLTLRLIHTWFRQQMMTRTGLSASASNSLVAQELARRGRGDAGEYQDILDDCDWVLSQSRISQRQLTTTLAQLARLEKETRNGSGNGKQPGR